MSDISQCKWDKCIQKSTCHRFNAIPEPDNQQVYMHFENKCGKYNDYYWYWGDRNNIVKEEVELALIEEDCISSSNNK